MKHARSRQPGGGRKPRAPAGAPHAPRPASRPLGGLWAWAPVLAALLVAIRAWYPFVGEPVADDFDFLHHRSTPGLDAWLDGGGSDFYWRPLARQLYFRVAGDLVLAHPAWIAALHVVCLALAGWLLYRALRPRWPGAWAAAAASFPIVIEAGRTLIATATSFQDLGAILLSALALHQASRRRLPVALAAVLAALLCKEMAVVTALAMPLMVPAASGDRRERTRWWIASGAVVGAWALAYGWVVGHAGLLLAKDATRDPGALAVPWLTRFLWAAGHSLLDAMSLPALSPVQRTAGLAVLGAVAVTALIVIAIDRSARTRLRAQAHWIVGGLAWFALATATLADVHPDWRPYRSPFGAIGLGVACTALFGSIRPALLAALVGLRLATFLLCPGPSPAIAGRPTGGFSLDFAELVRLQRLTGETRRELAAVMPSPPRGARVANNYYPVGALHAFAGDRSLQTWYGDTTLRWVKVLAASAEERRAVAAVLQFQPTPPRQVAPLSVEGLWHLEQAAALIDAKQWDEALRVLAVADSLQRDPGARVFASMVAGKRALALGGLGRRAEADSVALQSLALWDQNDDAAFALAASALTSGRLAVAERVLAELVRKHPEDATLRDLLAQARRARVGGAP